MRECIRARLVRMLEVLLDDEAFCGSINYDYLTTNPPPGVNVDVNQFMAEGTLTANEKSLRGSMIR